MIDRTSIEIINTTIENIGDSVGIGIINAKDIQEAWFYNLKHLYSFGKVIDIDRGSFEKEQKRIQGQGIMAGIIRNPFMGEVVPTVPIGIPAPTTIEYIEKYAAEKLLGRSVANEAYTYGDRILEQLDKVIAILSKTPFTNQAIIEIARPEDIKLDDPPCLRTLSFKVIEHNGRKYLNTTIFFRSWDAWAGFPTNMGGILILVAGMLQFLPGILPGAFFYVSDGLHYYSMHEPFVKAVLHVDDKETQEIAKRRVN